MSLDYQGLFVLNGDEANIEDAFEYFQNFGLKEESRNYLYIKNEDNDIFLDEVKADSKVVSQEEIVRCFSSPGINFTFGQVGHSGAKYAVLEMSERCLRRFKKSNRELKPFLNFICQIHKILHSSCAVIGLDSYISTLIKFPKGDCSKQEVEDEIRAIINPTECRRENLIGFKGQQSKIEGCNTISRWFPED